MLKLSLTLDNFTAPPQGATARFADASGVRGFASSLSSAIQSMNRAAVDTSARTSGQTSKPKEQTQDRADDAQATSDEAQPLPNDTASVDADGVAVDEQTQDKTTDEPVIADEPDTDAVDEAPVDAQTDQVAAAVSREDTSQQQAESAGPSAKAQVASAEATQTQHNRDQQARNNDAEKQGKHNGAGVDRASQRAEPQQPVQQPQQSSESVQQPLDVDTPQPKDTPEHLVVKEQQQQQTLPMQHSERVDPAIARAALVDAAIRLEQATGQPAVDPASSRPMVAAMQGGASVTGQGVSGNGEQIGQLLNAAGDVDEDRVASRIVRGLTTMINQRGGSMNMRLDPPELGQLRVQMTIARGVVNASFVASTSQAHAILEKNLATLRIALEGQGLTVDRLSVQLGQGGSGAQHMLHDDDTNKQNQQQRQQHDAAGGQSRGRRDDDPSRQQPADFATVVAETESFATVATGEQP